MAKLFIGDIRCISKQVLGGIKGSISLEERNRRKANRKRARARKMRRGW